MGEELEHGDLLALERQVCFAAVTASRALLRLYRPVLEPLGLTHPQYLVMLALWERSPRTLRDLAEELLLEPPTLTPLIKRLEGMGLVERARNPLDERELSIRTTEAGALLRSRAEAVPVQIATRLGLSVTELQQARSAMRDLATAAISAVGELEEDRPGTTGLDDARN